MPFMPPTTMMEFFRKSEGIWLTQRSVHHFDGTADQSGVSNLYINTIAPDRPEVEKICSSQGLDPSLATGGASFSWQDNLDDREPNPHYAAILIDVPDDATGRTGKLLRDRGYVENLPVISRYRFAPDNVLTIETDYDNNQGQERCWFVSDDFRVRVSSVRMMGGINLMTYCSEFRCLSSEVLDRMQQRNRELAAGQAQSIRPGKF